MKLFELETGAIFCIDGTRSYPKLKLKRGYVDIRDVIINKDPPSSWDVEIISKEELYKDFADSYGITKPQADEVLRRLGKIRT